jgi:hypothetical protein
VNFDGEVRAAQFTLIACNTGVCISDLDNECVHLKNFGGAEFNTDAAPLAVSLDDFDFRFRAHERLSPFKRNYCLWQPDQSGGILAQAAGLRHKKLVYSLQPAAPKNSLQYSRH